MQMPDFTAFPVKSGIIGSLQCVKKVCVIPQERMSPVRQSAPKNLPKRHAATVFRLRIEKTVIARALVPVAIRTQNAPFSRLFPSNRPAPRSTDCHTSVRTGSQ